MKILVIGKFPPIEGGVSRDTFWLVHALAAAGHEVHVVTNADHVEGEYRIRRTTAAAAGERVDRDALRPACRIHPVAGFQRARYIPFAAPFVSAVAGRAIDVVRTHGIELIFAYYLEPYGVAAQIASRATGVPFGLRHAGSDIGRLMQHPDLKTLYADVFASADYVFSSSKTYRRLRHIGVCSDRMYSLPPMFLHEKYFAPALDDAQRAAAGRPVTIGMYGKIGEAKGSFDLLRAAAGAIARGHDVRLSLMVQGAAHNEQRLQQAIEQHGLAAHVERHPFRPHWEVPDFIRSCDAVCFLERDFSIPIHQPIVPLEVLACGVPLIVSHEIAAKVRLGDGLRHGEHALVVDPKSDELEAALVRVAEDGAAARALAQRGCALFQRHATPSAQYANQVSEVFGRILADVTQRRKEMSLAEMQAAVARLYTDRTFRRLFELDADAALHEYELTDAERDTLGAIDRKAIRQYAASLRSKVRGQYEDSMQAFIVLLGQEAWRKFFDRYYALYPARPGETHEERVRQCAKYLREYIGERPELAAAHPHLLDLLRFDGVRRELRSRIDDADRVELINEAAIAEPVVTPDSLVRLSGQARVEKFGFDVGQLLARLQDPATDPLAAQACCALFVVAANKAFPDVMPINDGLFALLDSIDRSEATVADLCRRLAGDRYDAAIGETLSITRFLAKRGAITVRNVEAASSPEAVGA